MLRARERAAKAAAAQNAAPKTVAKTAKEGIAALGTQTKVQAATPAPTPTITASFDADQLLSTLSFNQAIALYKKLKAMLGEV